MKPKLKTLKNGLRIVSIPIKESPTVTVLVMVETGARYETKETNGLSHFLEHMCFKGTQKRKALDIAYELEAMGAETNAFTGYDYTGYYAKGRSELFPKLLDVVADVYQNSTFPEQEIEKERGVIMGEIDMTEDVPQARIGYLFLESLYGDQPAGRMICGPKENIKKFSRDDFVTYHKQHYVAEKTLVIVAGNVEHATVAKEIEKAFAHVARGKILSKKKITKETGNKFASIIKSSDQAHVVLGLRALPLGHKDLSAFSVMTAVLGQGMSSRLFIKLREEMGAGYYVSAGNGASDDAGEFEVATGTEPKRVPEIIDAIKGETARMRTERVPAHELAKTKEYLVGRLYMGLESSDAIAQLYASQAIFHRPFKTPKEIEKETRAVTAEDVLKAAKKYLKEEHFHIATIGPKVIG
jgi:predicted Zn-dependent peptidase